MRYILLICTLLAFCLQADAQDDAVIDQLPIIQPSDVFVDSVEIIETLAELNTDGASSVFYYLAPDSESWELLPPPDALSPYVSLETERLRNGNFRVVVLPDIGGSCLPATPIFEFAPATRLFTQKEQEIEAPELWQYWGLFYPNPPENIRLRNYCQLDVFGAELPDDMSDLIRSSTEQFAGEGGGTGGLHTPEYFIVPTPFPNDDDNYLFAIYTIADDTWSESFPLALSGEWTFRTLGFEDGVLYFLAMGQDSSIYYSLDIASKSFNELFQRPYPQPVLSKFWENLYYYIGYDETHYQFYRYDLFSQQEDVIAELPCAAIIGDCEALYLTDSNWWTDIADLMFVLRGQEIDEGVPYFVVDVTNTKLMYSGLFPTSSIGIRWLHKNGLQILVSVNRDEPEPYALLADLDSDNPAESELIVPYHIGDVSPVERNVIVYVDHEEDDTRTIGVVDLETLEYRPVTLPYNTNRFGISIFWRPDETLQVTVYSHDTSFMWNNPIPLRSWIIRP
jgi:hypothetical protein